MTIQKSNSKIEVQGGIEMNQKSTQGVGVKTHYLVECFDKEGKQKWVEDFENLVVTEGLNTLLDYTFKTGHAAPTWYVGLKGTGTPAAGDLMSSHVTWSTISPYSNATDPAFTPGTISSGSVDNSASKAVFNINASETVYGCFLKDDNTVDGATGILYGAGDFTSPRAVLDGDTLNITITLTVTAA